MSLIRRISEKISPPELAGDHDVSPNLHQSFPISETAGSIASSDPTWNDPSPGAPSLGGSGWVIELAEGMELGDLACLEMELEKWRGQVPPFSWPS